MNRLSQLLDKVFPPVNKIPAGMYHYQAPPESELPYRLHLRIDATGSGTLVVNASTVLHLNQTASEYVYHLVSRTPPDEVERLFSKRYKVRKEQVRQDFQDLVDRIQTLIETPDLDPVTFLDFDRQDPYSGDIPAPYRLDCAITYQVEDKSITGVAPVDRVREELNTDNWKTILDKAWNAGIPHIIFTGGEPTLRPDLPDLIAHSEKLGQVTGILTDGLRLVDADYRNLLLQSGLDHLMLVIDTKNQQAWDALEKLIAEDIFVTVHLTITPDNSDGITNILERLTQMGVKSLSLSVSDLVFRDKLKITRQSAAEMGLTLVWDLPVPYSQFHPVALEMEEAEQPPTGAGRAWLYVEPDGDVLKAQGIPGVLGNLMTDPWEAIWKK